MDGDIFLKLPMSGLVSIEIAKNLEDLLRTIWKTELDNIKNPSKIKKILFIQKL
jgi:hypothetical protein